MKFKNMSKSDRVFIGILILIFCVIAMSVGITLIRMGSPIFKLLGIAFIISGIYGGFRVVTTLLMNKSNNKNNHGNNGKPQ